MFDIKFLSLSRPSNETTNTRLEREPGRNKRKQQRREREYVSGGWLIGERETRAFLGFQRFQRFLAGCRRSTTLATKNGGPPASKASLVERNWHAIFVAP